MRTYAAVGIVLLGSALGARAQEVGIGMNWRGGPGILIPVKVRENLMLEGSIAFSDNTYTYKDVLANTQENSTKETSFGVGVFWLKPTGDSTRAYIGPRIAYNQYKTSDESYGTKLESKTNTWSIAPTLGIEYFPVKNVSIGGEVGLSYAHATGSSSFAYADLVKGHSVSTTSSVMIRYYF